MTTTAAELIEQGFPADLIDQAERDHGPIRVYGAEPPSEVEIPEPDTGRAELANRIANAIETFWIAPSRAYVVLLSVWIVATWNQAAFDIAPYLRLKGDSMGSKGVVERLIQYLAYPGRSTDGTLQPHARRYAIATAATMYRTIERYDRPTLILCEAGKWLGESSSKFDKYEDVKAIVQEGFERGATVPRWENGEVKDFDVFCPKVLSGTGQLPRELENRCVPIVVQEVERARHRVTKFRPRTAPQTLTPIRDAIAELSTDEYRAELASRELQLLTEPGTPGIPDVQNRADDMCPPLVAIGDSLGEGWGRTVRQAITEVFPTGDSEPSASLDVRFMHALMHAMRQKYVAATSRHQGRNSPPLHGRGPVGTLTNSDFGHPTSRNGRQPFRDFSLEIAPDKQEAHLYVAYGGSGDRWAELHQHVSRANRGAIEDADTIVAALAKAGRLTRDGRNLGTKLAIWRGSPQVRCLRINISDLFAWESAE